MAKDEAAKRMALRAYDLLAQEQALRTTTSVIVIEAAAGELALKGRVRTNNLRNLAQRLARHAMNGWQLHNELISDEQLALDIAAKLAMDPRTAMADVRCEMFLGVANLKGVVRSKRQHQAVLELAEQVPGVAGINDFLAIVG
jgi:osmotically-inducible protein OsmY